MNLSNDQGVSKKKNIGIIVILFILILAGSRIFWNISFHNTDQPRITDGQLDLRNWDMKQGTITLDGDWEFYPHQWLIHNQREDDTHLKLIPTFIQVPGGWNESLHPDDPSPYGFGSYRLRILVNPEIQHTYSIRVNSVRSASELYVNNRLLYQIGQPTDSPDSYVASNVPYTTSFTSDQSEIEVIVQVANYKDPRKSGIVRSMKFGTEELINREAQLSVSMQQMTAFVFLVHAVYAFYFIFC